MCCHFALYRRLFGVCRPLERHGQRAFSVAHPPTLFADPSARAKGHRMAFWRADGPVSPRHTLFPTSFIPSFSPIILSRSLSFFFVKRGQHTKTFTDRHKAGVRFYFLMRRLVGRSNASIPRTPSTFVTSSHSIFFIFLSHLFGSWWG